MNDTVIEDVKRLAKLYENDVTFINNNTNEVVLTGLFDDLAPPPPTLPCPTYEEVRDKVYAGLEAVYDSDDNFEHLSHFRPGSFNIFEKNSFYTINIMSQCSITAKDGPTDLDLRYLCSIKNEMFYVPEKLPSLLIHMGELAPTALFTRTGFLTMTGGASLEEIQFCMTYCCHKILFILNKVYPYKEFKLGGFSIHNKVCKTRLEGYKINLQVFVDEARRKGYVVKYDADQINMVYITPGPPFSLSISASIAAKGGVLIMGFTKTYEARAVANLLSSILEHAARECDPEAVKAPPRSRLKQNKKIKNLKKWRTLAKEVTP